MQFDPIRLQCVAHVRVRRRFVLITDPQVPSLRECLKQIYTHIYVEHVVKNPVRLVPPLRAFIQITSLKKCMTSTVTSQCHSRFPRSPRSGPADGAANRVHPLHADVEQIHQGAAVLFERVGSFLEAFLRLSIQTVCSTRISEDCLSF